MADIVCATSVSELCSFFAELEFSSMTLGKPIAGVCAATALFVCGAAGFPTPPSSLPAATGALALGGPATTSLTAGEKVTLSANGFASSSPVTLVEYSSPTQLGTATTDSAGHLATSVTLDPNLTGSHTLVALGNAPDGSAMSVESAVQIAPAESAPSGAKQLAWTGVQTLPWATGSIIALLSGVALVRAAKGRRTLPVR